MTYEERALICIMQKFNNNMQNNPKIKNTGTMLLCLLSIFEVKKIWAMIPLTLMCLCYLQESVQYVIDFDVSIPVLFP